MIKYNIRAFAYAILGLGIITFLIIFLFISNSILSAFSSTVAINIILWMIFTNWAWKFKIFYPWLIPFPNLSGEWEGHLISSYLKDGKPLPPIPTKVTIGQTFFNVQVQIQTGESKSFSTGASFDIDSERGLHQLFYSYLNTPKPSVRDRSEMHYGTTRLEFKGFNVDELEGEYWTSRKTTGELHLKRKK